MSLVSTVRLEVEMAADLLKASEAARRLGIPTKELLRLVHERKIRYVMVKGIAHVPDDAVEEFRAKASCVHGTQTRTLCVHDTTRGL